MCVSSAGGGFLVTDTRLYRVRIVLQINKPARLHAHHAATLYALVAAGYGQSVGQDPVMPDGVLLDAPEQCRVALEKDAKYAFGMTILAAGDGEASQVLARIRDGLVAIGRQRNRQRLALAGNFRVSAIEDLVASQAYRPGYPLAAIPHRHLAEEIDRARELDRWTLRFLSPLRCHRSKKQRVDGHAFFDREVFVPRAFAQRLDARLRSLGVRYSAVIPQTELAGLRVADNRLVWLDLTYGPKRKRKALGGAVGRVALEHVGLATAAALVWGQYVRIGESTRFGFGSYRIEELGPDPFACARAVGLLPLALNSAKLDATGEAMALPSGEVRSAARRLLDGQYTPAPHFRISIPKPDGGSRTLAVPGRRDRALQRAVLDTLAPALDLFFEESSLAYRQGLGRQRAAQRINKAYSRGYRWAVYADFRRFFDTVDHGELRERLEAYVADDGMVGAIMAWIAAGSPQPGIGLPTGAPLSPLVSNLLLDQFDEEVQRDGGWLVRYADDFVILFRDRDEAERVFHAAQEAAENLRLELNTDKTRVVDLNEPFEFLGFRFQRREQWEYSTDHEPRRLEDLGWKQRKKATDLPEPNRLAGETPIAASPQATVIWGPGVSDLHRQGGKLICSYADGRPTVHIAIERIRELIVLGPPTVTSEAFATVARQGVHVLVLDDYGRLLGSFLPEQPLEDATAIQMQAAAAADGQRRLHVARELVSAKLRNYAVLAKAYPAGYGRLAGDLRRQADEALQCTTVESLLGVEGSGAAKWYGAFTDRLAGGFSFTRRVAPDAADPVNVMLNIAQTVLHRHLVWMCRLTGLAPSLGLLHRPRSGHAALASDMQEPFRHLMDRAVIEASRRIRPSDFQFETDGRHPLRIKQHAYRRLLVCIHQMLARSCQGVDQSEARSYRLQMLTQIRSLRRSLSDPSRPFRVFRHP